VVSDGIVEPIITSNELESRFREVAGAPAGDFPFPTSVFAFDLRSQDEVLACTAGNRLPLIIRRDGEVILNFDVQKSRIVTFSDSKRPIYTYIPKFNVQLVPEAVRRPVSNLVESLRGGRRPSTTDSHKRLPLTSFEFTVLLLNTVLASGLSEPPPPFRWPAGKRAVFVPLHDVDTDGFLRRREQDPLFQIEQKHQVRSTWFIPTKILNSRKHSIDYLREAGNEVGWHGHKHDHRDHVKPFAEVAVQALADSCLREPENFPTGMRLPKLLKSNYLFDLLERSCPALCYDTSFQKGIAPYYPWVNGRESKILEIPTTVPTDITVYNESAGLPRTRKVEAMLAAQIARTQKLIAVGGLISIVTHPEKTLSERPDFLDVYDQYLAYIRSNHDIWFTTAGELFKYWTGFKSDTASHAA
jgi:peptidoglycan/xylan/chitin deacetylase (PgdA/CDA1 family)